MSDLRKTSTSSSFRTLRALDLARRTSSDLGIELLHVAQSSPTAATQIVAIVVRANLVT
jgi:hypothetical protein